jgi:hypothetical protein
MLLDIRTRQLYLSELGFYKGEVDGVEGKLTKAAYLKLQKKYFTKSKRKKEDQDGLYGKDTDILLRNAYKCRNLKHFKLSEFKCKCKKDCTGYPVELNDFLLIYLQDVRKTFNKTMKITSGLRCKKYNSSLEGSSPTSRHLSGRAIDTKVSGYTSLSKRKDIIDHWIENYPKARRGYCDDYSRTKYSKGYTSHSNMGTSIHLDVN